MIFNREKKSFINLYLYQSKILINISSSFKYSEYVNYYHKKYENIRPLTCQCVAYLCDKLYIVLIAFVAAKI